MSVQVDEPDLPPIICIERIEQLGICDQKCLWQRSCNKLHICAQFVYSGKCSYEKDKHCRFGHDLKSSHNSWVLQQNGLEKLTIEILRGTHLQNRKNIKSVPICPNYNSEEQHHDEDKCTALHICYKHRYEGCIRESCSLSHELTDERSQRILKHYGIHDAETLPQIFRMMQEGPNIEMPRFLEYFVAIEKIGSGGFSTVYRARHILDQQTYAVKRIPIRPDKVEEAKKEVEILSNLEHRNIIRYFYSWIDSSNRNLNEQWTCLYIQMEYCDEKTLENIVYKDDKFKLPLQKMFCQIVDAVEYIHSKNIVHGDLKPQNIFIERGSSNIKIGDFGIALDFSDGDRLPKEYACATSSGKKDAEKLKKSDDINSLVLIALKMFCQMKNEEEFKKLERESKKSVPKQQAPNINPKMYQLIHRMLNADNTGEEITAKELQKELQTYQDRHSEIDILELSAELDRIIPDQGHIEEHLPLDR